MLPRVGVVAQEEKGPHWRAKEPELTLGKRLIPFDGIALSAGRHNVIPGRLPSPGSRQDVVNGKPFHLNPAILAGVAVPLEDILFAEGDLAPAGQGDVAAQTDNTRKTTLGERTM